LVILATEFDRALVVRIPPNTATCLGAEALAMLFVAAGTG
jgi:hypothetical protein